MHKWEKILRSFLIFWVAYLFFEALLYLSNIRLTDVKNVWTVSALVYSGFVEHMLGSAFVILALVGFEMQRDLKKYKNLCLLSSFWTLFHGGILVYTYLSQDYLNVYAGSPSLYVWLPFYNSYLLLEASVLFAYSLVVYMWIKNR